MLTLVIYPGSFRPFHKGHLNILEKSENIFGKGNVIVAMGINPSKDVGEIKADAEKLSNRIGRKVEFYGGFLHDFIIEKEKIGYNVVIVRGLRNGDDLAYENNQLKFIEDFKPDVKTIFIMPDKKYEHISSTAIRQLEAFSAGSAKNYLI